MPFSNISSGFSLKKKKKKEEKRLNQGGKKKRQNKTPKKCKERVDLMWRWLKAKKKSIISTWMTYKYSVRVLVRRRKLCGIQNWEVILIAIIPPSDHQPFTLFCGEPFCSPPAVVSAHVCKSSHGFTDIFPVSLFLSLRRLKAEEDFLTRPAGSMKWLVGRSKSSCFFSICLDLLQVTLSPRINASTNISLSEWNK